MRKTLLCIILLALTGNVAAQDFLSNSEVNSQWRDKRIPVKDGGQAPGVVTLLKAFHQANPTWVVNEVIKQADKPASTTFKNGTATIYESEEDYRILIDKPNGYVDLSSQTDMEQMQACVWSKNDGHRIFAVSLYEQHDPVQNLLCWYDYDPTTQAMIPAHSPLDEFKPSCEGATVHWHLPMKGTDFEIYEYYNVLPNPIIHTYKWDRINFNHSKTQIHSFEYFPSVGSTHYAMLRPGEWDYYSLVDLTGEHNPVLVLGKMIDGQFTHYIMLAQFKSDLCQIAEASPAGEKIAVYQLPPEGSNQRVAVQYRDLPGGFWYSILTGCYVQFTLSDLPNFSKASAEVDARIISVEEGYGAPDETTDILDQLGEQLYYGAKLIWHLFEVSEEELP